jgi:hypothetical protein
LFFVLLVPVGPLFIFNIFTTVRVSPTVIP